MTPDHETSRLRRYALGALSEEECAAIEQQYFVDDDALEQLAIAEDQLIEDYLENRLDAEARDRFEHHYLSTPGHRARMSVVHRLRATAVRAGLPQAVRESSGFDSATRWSRSWIGTPASWSPFQQAALAASIVLILGAGAVWLFYARPDTGRRDASTSTMASSSSSSTQASSTPASSTPASAAASGSPTRDIPPATSPRAPVIVSLSLPSIAVRGAGADPTVTIPADADALVLRLKGEGSSPLRRGRAVVRLVAGNELWRGLVETPRDLQPGVRALVRIPAARLRAGDLIVELHGIGADGRESEQARYAVRVKVADRR
jgi:hypothetical protein